MGFEWADFRNRHRDAIIDTWVHRLQTEVSEHYAKRPREELAGTVAEAFEANYRAVVHGDFSRIRRFIDEITGMRLKGGLSGLRCAEGFRTVPQHRGAAALQRDDNRMNSTKTFSESTTACPIPLPSSAIIFRNCTKGIFWPIPGGSKGMCVPEPTSCANRNSSTKPWSRRSKRRIPGHSRRSDRFRQPGLLPDAWLRAGRGSGQKIPSVHRR